MLRILSRKLDIEADRKDVIRLWGIGYLTVIPLIYYASILGQSLFNTDGFQTGPTSLLLVPITLLLAVLSSWLLFPSKWPFIISACLVLPASLIAQYQHGLQAYTSFVVFIPTFLIFLESIVARVLSAVFIICSACILLITMQNIGDTLVALRFFISATAIYAAFDLYAIKGFFKILSIDRFIYRAY